MSDEFFMHVEKGLSSKGRYKLANAVAHGGKLEAVEEMVRVKRGNDYLLITTEGDIYKAVKCI